MGPAKKDQEKPPEERAKQSGPLKKASSLFFSSDEEVLRSTEISLKVVTLNWLLGFMLSKA